MERTDVSKSRALSLGVVTGLAVIGVMFIALMIQMFAGLHTLNIAMAVFVASLIFAAGFIADRKMKLISAVVFSLGAGLIVGSLCSVLGMAVTLAAVHVPVDGFDVLLIGLLSLAVSGAVIATLSMIGVSLSEFIRFCSKK